MDGHVEVMPQATAAMVAGAPTIEELFVATRAALDGSDPVKVTVNQQYGYLSRVERTSTSADGSSTQTIADFTTPGDVTAIARGRAIMDTLLDRWANLQTPSWQYTWTRVDASTPGTPTGWTVRTTDGATTATPAGGGEERAVPDDVTVNGTVAAAAKVIASGGWVDVSVDDRTGLNALFAVDPSPSTKGDGYWIRIEFTDRAAARQRELLDSAKARWAAAKVKRSSYVWTYDGDRGAWNASISATGDVLKFLRRSGGAPSGDAFEIRPSVKDAFAAIDAILAEGGSISVTYDKALGYPKKIVIANGGTVAAKGTITITKFKKR
jgi:hypothetical protein